MLDLLGEKGIGNLFKPLQIRRVGRAYIDVKRDELLILAQAQKDVEAILRGELIVSIPNTSNLKLLPASTPELIDPPKDITPQGNDAPQLVKTLTEAALADDLRKEINVGKAILQAEAELENETQEPSTKSMDDDWLYRWRDCASETSSENLQNLWGKLLAGEVKSPGSFSLRTLEFLRNISSAEASKIAKLPPFVIDECIYRNSTEILEKEGITFGFLLEMQELGVLYGVESIGISKTWSSYEKDKYLRVLVSNRKALIVKHSDPLKEMRLPMFGVTKIGVEVLRLGKFEHNDTYLRKIGEHLLGQGFEVDIADYRFISDDRIEWYNSEKISLPT